MEKNYSDRLNRLSKKMKSINYLGGKCEFCGEDNFFKLSFHHIKEDDKTNNLNVLKGYRWSIIEKELQNCKLLCHNCHMKLHYENDLKNRRNTNKKTFLEFKNINCCEKCGYNECNASLDFHHLDSNEKDFMLTNIFLTYNNVYDLTEKIQNELDKCIVLCKNCHFLEHSDIDFFEKHKNIILEKSNNIKEIQSKIDRNEVKKLYKNGMKQIDIAKYFNASKGTVSGIIKELKIKK